MGFQEEVPAVKQFDAGVLNTAPLNGGHPEEHLTGERGADLARTLGGTASPEELEQLRRVRHALQSLIRGRTETLGALQQVLDEVHMVGTVTPGGLSWSLAAPDDVRLAAQVIQAGSAVNQRLPGRLRACANEECNLYLIDHTRPGTAKWCSMATCGNRMKARAHAARRRSRSR